MAIDFLIYPHPKGWPNLVMASPLADAIVTDLSTSFSEEFFLLGSDALRLAGHTYNYAFISTDEDYDDPAKEELHIIMKIENALQISVVNEHLRIEKDLPLIARGGEFVSPFSVRATVKFTMLALSDSLDFRAYCDDYREIFGTHPSEEKLLPGEANEVLIHEEIIDERTSCVSHMTFRSGMWIPLKIGDKVNAIAHLEEQVGKHDFEVTFWSATPIDHLERGNKLRRRIVRQGCTAQAGQVLEKEIGILL